MIPLAKMKPKPRKPSAYHGRSGLLFVDLRAMRTSRNIGLRQAARAAGLDQATLGRIELGFDPDIRNALRVAEFYGLPVDKIWSLTGSTK